MLQIKGDGEKITNILVDGMKWREQYRFRNAVIVYLVGFITFILGLAWAFSPLVK